MSKRLFQILDEMNVADGENNTQHVQVCSSLVSAQTAKGGGHVTMGVPAQTLHQIAVGTNKICILLVIDEAAFSAAKEESRPVQASS